MIIGIHFFIIYVLYLTKYDDYIKTDSINDNIIIPVTNMQNFSWIR